MDHNIVELLLLALIGIGYFIYRSGKSRERDFRWEAMNANGISAKKKKMRNKKKKYLMSKTLKP